MGNLFIYNTLSRRKEEFMPIHPPNVGLYVCGPTVYGDAHLGHARPALTFDLLYRYLEHLGYRVRYVRNITDVGHLENDEDQGEDKVAKKARLEQKEPMEIVQYYLNRYHSIMDKLNVLPPRIEPMASGHIIEQQEMVRKIIDAGFAYESNGSVYFDVPKYNEKYNYGKLSGRKIEDLLSNTRELERQYDKRSPLDFAIWKKAEPAHIMRWPSEWSEGFPGWHLECSAMSTKYLGEVFDIHGGGMDLMFPHHECEIAQSVAASGKESVRYWMHNNLITINGQKMGKSLDNFINLEDIFTGNNKLLDKAYSPMTIRLFMLQAHYRSTLDFSIEALQAAEKGFKRLMEAAKTLKNISPSEKSSININQYILPAFDALNDDLNSPMAMASLFESVKMINSVRDGHDTINTDDLNGFRSFFDTMVYSILGFRNDESGDSGDITSQLVEFILSIRQEAKEKKDFSTSDRIRKKLNEFGIEIRDRKDGADWGWLPHP